MTITMFDSVNLDQIPADAPAVAGYTSGTWPTFSQLAAGWPNAHRLSIAITANRDADCLDIEGGDATPDETVPWVRRQLARGVERPCVYTSVSLAQHVLDLLDAAGISRAQVRLWTAHYGDGEHLCGPQCTDVNGRSYGLRTTADATQWTNRALGRNLDQSLCADDFFGQAPPASRPAPLQEDDMPAAFLVTDPATGNIWGVRQSDGATYSDRGEPVIPGLNAHPEWNAVRPDDPVVGAAPWKDENGEWGIVIVTQDAQDGNSLHFFHFHRNGQPG